jgi:hypothetical protein
MYKISIPTSKAYDAIRWAKGQFENFGVQHQFPANRYEFEFDNSEDATIFALRWMQ